MRLPASPFLRLRGLPVMLGAAFLFLWAAAAPLRADMLSVYVDYKPLKVEYVLVLDEVFAPADDVVELLKEKITYDPGTLWISLGSRELALKGLQVKDKVFLPLKSLAREIGYVMEMDREKNVLNIDTSRKAAPPAASASSSAAEQGSPQKKRGLIITFLQEDPITNVLKQVTALRIYADVKNDKARPAENVKAHCIFRYPGGDVYFDDVVSIERLEPGEMRRVVFYSVNPINTGVLEYELTVRTERIKKEVVR